MYLPAEWHEQEFVQLTWPHEHTDWAPMLDEVQKCYVAMARAIAAHARLVIVTPQPDLVRQQLPEIEDIHIIRCDTNDTWARDHAFVTCLEDGERHLMDYQFNGWGLKFAANLDNQINKTVAASGIISGAYHDKLDFVLEGGSIESDGVGTLLTTTSCLLAPNRNARYSKQTIETRLCEDLGAERVLWLRHGHLDGDDTDGHIDTLARFCDTKTIAYVRCEDKNDPHYASLRMMEEELKQFRTSTGEPYKLVPLPLPRPIYDKDTENIGNLQRLPATYANFLITNRAVLLPTYAQKDNDAKAVQALRSAFPRHDIIAIDCQVLIRQHGSLHCCTMQYPRCGKRQ